MSKALYLTFLIVSIFEGTEEATVVNVAWGGLLQQCVFPVDNRELVDGDRFKLALTHTENCEKDFTVIFEGDHEIHYVVLYGGETAVDGVARFDVEFRVFSRVAVCGNYIRRRTLDFRGMRVNCVENFLTSRVFIDVKRVPFYLNEIEVYSFEDDGRIMIYRGCYKHFPTEISFRLRETYCKMYCILKWLSYVAYQGPDCFCTNDFDESQEPNEEDCQIVCNDTLTQACGGTDAYSVFIVKIKLPSYKACREDFNVTNATESVDMTIVKCLQLCDDNYYAALQGGTFCLCLDDDDEFEDLEDTNCSVPCSGDPNFYCGGVTEWSIYRTCKDCIKKTLPCSLLLRCAGDYDVFGICKDGCKKGYFGEHCLELESKSQSHLHLCNEEKCKDKPNSYCYYHRMAKTFLCYCNTGFWNSKDGSSCEDIDECMYMACDDVTSTCENVLGSYKCICKSGYHQITDLLCGGQGKHLKTIRIMMIIGAVMMTLLIIAMLYIISLKTKQIGRSESVGAKKSSINVNT